MTCLVPPLRAQSSPLAHPYGLPSPTFALGKKKYSKNIAIIQTPKVNLRVTLNWKRGGCKNPHYCVSACVGLGSMWLNHIPPLCAQTGSSYSSGVKFCWCKWFTVFVGNNCSQRRGRQQGVFFSLIPHTLQRRHGYMNETLLETCDTCVRVLPSKFYPRWVTAEWLSCSVLPVR